MKKILCLFALSILISSCKLDVYTNISSFLNITVSDIVEIKAYKHDKDEYYYFDDNVVEEFASKVLNIKLKRKDFYNGYKYISDFDLVVSTDKSVFYINDDYATIDNKRHYYELVNESIYKTTCEYIEIDI